MYRTRKGHLYSEINNSINISPKPYYTITNQSNLKI